MKNAVNKFNQLSSAHKKKKIKKKAEKQKWAREKS